MLRRCLHYKLTRRTYFAFSYNIFIQSNLKSLKSSEISISDTFSFLFVFVIIIFAIFKDRVFTTLFIDSEDVYIRNYRLYLDWPLYPTM